MAKHTTSSGAQRYRTEEGAPCVDVKVDNVEHLFDNRDPAPFRQRDLDPALVEYLRDAAEDLSGHRLIRLVVWLAKPCAPKEIEEAMRSHFRDEIERIRRRRRGQRRAGQIALVIAIALVVALLALAQLVSTVVPGSIGAGLKEGLTISSWVVMWRPIEVLIYDWIPRRQERKVLTKILEAPISVRTGGPSVA